VLWRPCAAQLRPSRHFRRRSRFGKGLALQSNDSRLGVLMTAAGETIEPALLAVAFILDFICGQCMLVSWTRA
jgi:hypothetical protein